MFQLLCNKICSDKSSKLSNWINGQMLHTQKTDKNDIRALVAL